MGNSLWTNQREDNTRRANLKREFNIVKVEALACKYEQLRFEADLGEKSPEMLKKELKRVTTDLTKLLVSGDLSPERRKEVIKEVKQVSFEKFYPSGMYENPDFDQDMVETAYQVGDAKSSAVRDELVIGALMNTVEIKASKDMGYR